METTQNGDNMFGFSRVASVTLMAAALLLSGCGGDDDNASGSPPTNTGATDLSAQSAGWTPQQAQWIGRDTPAAAPEIGAQALAPLLRRSFTVRATPKRVVARIASYGLYVAYLNGARIGTQVLEPPPTKFESEVLYGTFDVTAMIVNGPNAIGIKLGRGYLGAGPSGTGLKYRGEPRVLAELDIEYLDGSHEYVSTDGDWKTKDSATRDAMMYGEAYDASAETAQWNSTGLDDSAWSAAKVQPAPTQQIGPRLVEPTRVIGTLAHVAQRVLADNRRVYDFGEITAGWSRIQVSGTKGTEVVLTYGEQLKADGTVYQAALIAKPTLVHVDRYTLSGNGTEVWEPEFTRHGFRYVQVDFSAPVQEFDVSAQKVYSALPVVGQFTSASEILNRLHANQASTAAINLSGIPTDTPWRDRLPWTADAWLYMNAARHNYDISRLYTQWIKSVRASQSADGSLPLVSPDYVASGSLPPNDPSWSGTMIPVVWTLYQAYGDRSVLADNYDAMKRHVDLMTTQIAATGYLYKGFTFGDWASPGSETRGSTLFAPDNDLRKIGIVPQLTANGDLYQEVKLLGQIADALGKGADAASLAAAAEQIKTAFNETFLDTEAGVYRVPGSSADYRQTSNLIPLAYGLVPESRSAQVYANLVADIRSRGTHLNTGSIGTRLILPVLTAHGDGDLAYALATQTTYPSWGYWLTQGATSSWETWANADLSQSLSHPFLGTYQEWLYEHLAGIQSASPGYASVKIQPIAPAALAYASASLQTPRGVVSSAWKRSGNTLTLDVTLPMNVGADIYVPKVGTGAVTLGSGTATAIDDDGNYAHYQTIGTGSSLQFSVR